ncbi:MAG: cell division protein ZapE [Gammaproteobacteria bacterium]|nr:cell division protein ZapE [Gammaproteobacteria bacterium]
MEASLTPRERYTRALEDPDFVEDAAQKTAIEALQRIYLELITKPALSAIWQRLRITLSGNNGIEPVKGLYLWGGVGRGKTHLMDMFFRALPFKQKQRRHFHRFMYELHEQLKNRKDRQDPLDEIARHIATRTRVICFDEFFVSDIADAMLLGTLFRELFRRGVTLVATSNVPPSLLYKGGLQRERFLPAISAIETHCQVMEIDGTEDFRLRILDEAEIYHSPLDQQAEFNLANYFEKISCNGGKADQSLLICGRPIATRRLANGIAWFNFGALCDGPRSQNDYLELARGFHTILVSGVPAMDSADNDRARRFIALVDELYDHKVKLILSAAVPAERLYQSDRLAFEFRRTVSRLAEMQTHAYLGQPHLA